MTVNILGTEWEIIISNKEMYPYLEDVDAFCDNSVHKIVVNEIHRDINSKENLQEWQNKVIRHELIHAFLYESGLAENSDWAMNEEMIDFFAMQFSKIKKVFEELNIT